MPAGRVGRWASEGLRGGELRGVSPSGPGPGEGSQEGSGSEEGVLG